MLLQIKRTMYVKPWIILLWTVEGYATVYVSSVYERNSEFDNVLPQNGQLWTVSSRSRTECTVICQKDSVCLSYFYKHPQCTGFPYRMTSYVSTIPDPGLKYAEMDVVDTLYVALLRGGWRDKVWLHIVNHDFRRNTLIVEMAKHSDHGGELQGWPDYNDSGASLGGLAVIYFCLRDNNVEPEPALLSMTYTEQRQRLITYLGGSPTLSSLNDLDLASHCF